jgi:hypothetical protein
VRLECRAPAQQLRDPEFKKEREEEEEEEEEEEKEGRERRKRKTDRMSGTTKFKDDKFPLKNIYFPSENCG